LPANFAAITTIVAASNSSQKQMNEGRGGSAAESTDLPRKSGGAFRRFLGHTRPMHDRARYPQGPRRVPHGQVPGPHDIGERQIRRRTAESLAGRTNAGEASAHSFGDSCPLKFGEGGKNVKLQPTGGGRAVDAFAQRHERDADGLQVLQQRDQMSEVAPEPIQTPANDDIELPALRVGEHLV
jgi:hypothetical protein